MLASVISIGIRLHSRTPEAASTSSRGAGLGSRPCPHFSRPTWVTPSPQLRPGVAWSAASATSCSAPLHSATLDEHFALIEEVFDLLHEAGYSVHFRKCMFCMAEAEFLGVVVGRAGVRPAPVKVKAVREMETPTTVGELGAVLGLADYLRSFVPDFSALTAPITDLLRDKTLSSRRARDLRVPWGDAQAEAFRAIISALRCHPFLATPDRSLPFSLHTDASELAAGAVLTQAAKVVTRR